MKVVVHPLPEVVEEKVCVLIDALRATCTLTTALSNGALRVKVVGSVEEALKYKGKALLAGERGGLKIDGFDLGNSPFDMEREIVKGKEIVMTTSNGTKAARMLKCEKIIAASFPNLPAVLDYLRRFDEVHVVCSGDNGKFSLEDFLLAGKIALLDEDPTDSGRIAAVYAESVRNVYEEILKSSHARRLIGLGFEKDVKFCSEIGTQNVVPVMMDGAFTRGENL